MGKKGGPKHLKRLSAPITYKIPRKTGRWAIKTSPGPHPADRSMPIAVLIRDVFGIATNLREVKYILRKGYVRIDGKIIRDYSYPVGLMDVIELVPEKKFYRMLPDKISLIYPYEVKNDEERYIKPLRIKRKTIVKNGNIQITTHDGRNFLFRQGSSYSSLKPGDTLVYRYDSSELDGFLKFEKGSIGLITRGSRIGRTGIVVDISKPHPLRPRVVKLESGNEIFETIFDYVFIVGKEKPIIGLGEVI